MTRYNNDLLSTKGLNTITFTDPYAKLCFNSMIILGHYYNNNHQEKQQKKIIYIDLDTTFTAYLNSGLLLSLKRSNSVISQVRSDTGIIHTYLPTERTFESILKDVISSMTDSSIVIFDSVNSFYNMYYNKIIDFDLGGRRGISRLNHLLSIFLMLLLKHGISLNIPILATSMIRYKKKDGEWKMSLTSKRILQRKSIVNLNVEMINDDDLSVTILQHPTLTTPQTLIFNDQSVKF